MALASIDDYETITGATVPDGSTARVQSLLDMAESAVLAGAHGQLIESQQHEDITLRPVEGVAYFPQRPVTAVASVTLSGVELVEGTDYRWTPGGDGRPAKLIRQSNGVDHYWSLPSGVDGWPADSLALPVVTYTAGWDPVPPQVVALVVFMAHGLVTNGANPQPTQQTVGPFSASFGPDASASPTLHVSEGDQAMLDRLCGVRAPGSVHIHRG